MPQNALSGKELDGVKVMLICNMHSFSSFHCLSFLSFFFLSVIVDCTSDNGMVTNRIYDGVEAETSKSQASFQII